MTYSHTTTPADMEIKYKRILEEAVLHGIFRADRTGVGSKSLFSIPFTIDLSDGVFPMITAKKMFFKSIVTEFRWFMNGETNIKRFQEENVHIWDSWADQDGNLGPVYGYQMRNFNGQGIDQMKEVMGMFSLFAGFQAQMMEMAKANMPGMIEEKSKGWPDLVAEFLPDALGILKQMTLKPAQAAPRTAPRPAQTFHSAPAQPAQPAPTQEGPTVLFEIPAMAQPAVVMLRRYSDLILQSREQHPEFTAEEMASELVGFIPPMLYRPALALCKVVKDRGPVALAAIHAEMGTEYWKDTLLAMVPTMEAILDGESEA